MQTEDKLAVYKTLLEILNTGNHEETEDSKLFAQKTTKEISSRDLKYTELLSHFVFITKIRNVLKEFFKWTFYLVIISSITVLIIIVYNLFNKIISSATIDQILECIPILITALVGFVSTIITIPVTITKYLFSTKEDQNITQIILHTQEHDTNGRQWAMDFNNIASDLHEDANNREEGSA